jgi:tRNA(Leu) C34 or U34 (ribose-2'-O)-methylase TrmL
MSDADYYERFNTRVDVAKAVGLAQVHPAVVAVMVRELFPSQAYEDLTEQQQQEVDEKAEELFYSYVFVQNAGTQHNKLKLSLQEDFAKHVDNYPRDRQAARHLMDKYTKTPKPKEAVSEGSSFATVGRYKKGTKEHKKFWAGKTCHLCGKKDHGVQDHTPEEIEAWKKSKAKNKDKSDDKSTSTKKSSKSTKSNKSSKSGKSSNSQLQALGKAFSQFGKELTSLPEESDLSASDDDEDAQSHFMFGHELAGVDMGPTFGVPHHKPHVTLVQMMQRCLAMATKIGKKFHGLDLSKCIALDPQSSCDFFNNPEYCTDIRKAPH